jgi:hypothetical protein
MGTALFRKAEIMGLIRDNYITMGISGKVGNLCVFKRINGQTFMTKIPDRSNVVYNKEQLEFREIFAKASKFASEIVNDPVKKAAYPRQGARSVYHSALADFLAEQKRNKSGDLSVEVEK